MPSLPTDNSVVEAKKLLILKLGVGFFSLIIIVFWLFNLSGSFTSTRSTAAQDQSAEVNDDWQQEFTDTFNSLQASLESQATASGNGEDFLQDMADNLAAREASPSPVVETGSPAVATVTPEQLLADLAARLPEAEQPAIDSCPQFINCMPSIGEAKPCVIPPGCENITQIAY